MPGVLPLCPHGRRRHAETLAMHRAIASVLALAALFSFLAAPTAASTAAVIEAEHLSLPRSAGQPFDDGAASGGRALLIWSNATASTSIATSGPTNGIAVRARGDQCIGAPVMRVQVNGREVLRTSVTSTTWHVYNTPLNLAPGAHTVSVSFLNDYATSRCDRNLRLDSVSLMAPPAANGRLEAEALTLPAWGGQPVDDESASGRRALLIWSTATATGTLSSGGPATLTVHARGDQCDGAPNMRVQLNGTTVLDATVPSPSWVSHSVPVAVPAGAHSITVSFTNDHATTSCDRNLRIDWISLSAASAGPSTTDPFEGQRLYVDPASPARHQADAWRTSRPADAALMDRIAAGATAAWFGEWSGDITAAVDRHVRAAQNAAALPVLVAYNIPQRDCGGWSAGGSGTPDGYRAWINAFSRGIGDRPAIVVLEPDALALLPCLSTADQTTRLSLLKEAVAALEARPSVSVYLDAGHSAWVPPAEMAARLTASGISAAEGFALNVSNYQPTSDSVRYALDLSSRVGAKRAIIDTSRNGRGSNGEWCNALGRALGPAPTATTADPVVDAYLWIKPPGESDGECNGGPAAGTWWPDYALGLAAAAVPSP